MYVPHFNAVEDPAVVRSFVRAVGAAELVTVDTDGTPRSTLLPVLWSADGGRIVAHMARANPHWREIAAIAPARALAIISGVQAYVSPGWYASKAEHGRVVPTWNYSAVHLTGTVTVHDDPAWVRAAVTDLTVEHESYREEPWSVSNPPEGYVTKQLRAIVGVEMQVEHVEAKAKLSQNRSDADRGGVAAGLAAEPDPRSRAMSAHIPT